MLKQVHSCSTRQAPLCSRLFQGRSKRAGLWSVLLVAGLLSYGLNLRRQVQAQEGAPDPQPSPRPPVSSALRLHIRPLPGQLNDALLFNSNNPEIIRTPGVLLDTQLLQQPLSGRFGFFAHHLVHRPPWAPEDLHLGLLAYNPGSDPVRLQLLRGQSFVTWPEAPFKQLPALSSDFIYAGPGDALASHWIRGGRGLPYREWVLAPQASRLLLEFPLSALQPLRAEDGGPPHVLIEKLVQGLQLLRTRVNARSSLIHFHSTGPLHLALVAAPHSIYDRQPTLQGRIWPQLQRHYQYWQRVQRAGPQEPSATAYDPSNPPQSGAFRYGRVAGVSRGLEWYGEAPLQLSEQTALAFPLSALYLKDLGSGQNQSAPLLARLPGSAQEAHGNYGVHYLLKLKLHNPTPRSLRCTIGLAHPNAVEADTDAYARLELSSRPPAEQAEPIRFRGSFQLRRQTGAAWRHVVLQQGQFLPELFAWELAPGAQEEGLLEWVYPPDATPPQLLTLRCQGH